MEALPRLGTPGLDGPLLDGIDLRRLRYFATVAEQRHFGRAAELLVVAQPALSQQVKALERELGVRLFDRTTRRVELTPAGAVLYPRVLALLSDAQHAVAEARRVADGAEGLLRLGFIGSATYQLMPTLARGLRSQVPSLVLELSGELLSHAVVRALADARLDMGFLRPFEAVPDVEQRRLRSEELVVALPSGHRLAAAGRVALDELADDEWVGYPREGSAVHAAVLDAARAAGFTPRTVAEVRETSALVSFVAAGIGVALVPQGVASVHIPGVAYLPLVGPPRTVDLVVAWRRDVPDALVRRVLGRLPL